MEPPRESLEPPPDLADPRAWSELIDALGPPSMLVLIGRRMGAALRAKLTAEDVWQEALLQAWRDRSKCEWRGVAAFRRWMVSVIDHRLHDLCDAAARVKRGGGRGSVPIEAMASADASSSPPVYAGPVASTTPSRVLADREIAGRMEAALDGRARPDFRPRT